MPRARKALSPTATTVEPGAKNSKIATTKPTTTRPRAKRAKTIVADEPPLVDAIAKRAYDLFVRDGAVHGRDMEHWLMAERQLLQEPPAPAE